MKKLCTICFLFVFLMLWIVLYPNYTFAAQIVNNPTTTNDSNYQVIEMFHSLDNQLCVVLENPATTGKTSIFPYLSMGKPYLWYIDNTNTNRMYLAFYNESTTILGGYTIDIYNNNNSQITCDGYKIDTIATFRVDFSDLSIAYVSGSEQHYVPAITYNYYGENIIDTMRSLGWVGDGASLSDLRSGLATINGSVIAEGNQTQQAINDTAQATQNTINSTAQATQNAINSSGQATQNAINSQTQQQQSNYDSFTNSTYYDNSVTVIDPNEFMDTVTDPNDTQAFLEQLYNLVYTRFTSPTRATTITLPLPHGLDPIVLSSSPIVQFYNDNPTISNLISMVWYFVIGRWVFSFCRRIFLWLATGSFVDTMSLSEFLSDQNEIIKTYMM